MSSIKDKVMAACKQAMLDKNKERLGTIRLITAAFKQKEVDERIELTDSDIIAILRKMLKQRRESIKMYIEANRQELADKEQAEVVIIEEFLPAKLSLEQIKAAIAAACQESGASSIKDMGKVIALLKQKLGDSADMSQIGQLLKEHFGGKVPVN